MYLRVMGTHWIRSALITANGLLLFWMMLEHLSSRARIEVS
ncbi:MAG TPA: hypothetical protein VKV15_07315 [Bryobacteraceae bacterium]|nr:hypothetical protein [Bryobacteraceae bacterium]